MGAFLVRCTKERTKRGLTMRVCLLFNMTSNTSVPVEILIQPEEVKANPVRGSGRAFQIEKGRRLDELRPLTGPGRDKKP